LRGLLKALASSCVRLGCAERQKGVCLEMLTITTTPPPPHNRHCHHVHCCTNRTLASTPHTIRELPKPGDDVQLDVVVGEGAYGKVRAMLLAPAPTCSLRCTLPYPRTSPPSHSRVVCAGGWPMVRSVEAQCAMVLLHFLRVSRAGPQWLGCWSVRRR
jgi:hypothetical protein